MTLNSIVRTKKAHPCGNDLWKITFVGADIKLKCEKCNHIILLPRHKATKAIKEILHAT